MHKGRILYLILAALLCALGLFFVIAFSGGASQSAPASSSRLRINEVMTSNKDSVPDQSGNFPSWLELYNPSAQAVDISGYGLSNSKKKAANWLFPSGTVIPPDGYIVVFCSGNEKDGPLHTSFKLSNAKALVLSDAFGMPIDSLQLKAVAKGSTLARDEKGAWMELSHPSPGFPNTDEGARLYRETLKAASTADNGIRINEFIASNSLSLPGPFGDYPDWAELYNTTGADIDISGCGFSDSIDRPMRFVFPQGTVIPANGMIIIYCSKRDGLIDGELHTPFALSANGGDVVFSNQYGEIVDSVSYSQLEKDISLARIPDGTGEFQRTSNITPGERNAN